jgi:hypothetical protein
MGDDRNRILELLAAGKITAEEAGRLLDALEANAAQAAGAGAAYAAAGATTGSAGGGTAGSTAPGDPSATWAAAGAPKYLFVKVVSVKGDNVNVKVPLGLVRAGLRLTHLIPEPARTEINKSMAERGISFDFNNFKPEDLEELIQALREMEIDVDSANGDSVKVYAA